MEMPEQNKSYLQCGKSVVEKAVKKSKEMVLKLENENQILNEI
jgi:hypothetical protein